MKKYKKVAVEVVRFDRSDVITASGDPAPIDPGTSPDPGTDPESTDAPVRTPVGPGVLPGLPGHGGTGNAPACGN